MEPNYCPNCGEKFDDKSLVKLFTELIFNHGEENEVTVPAKGWGVECFNCKWSGEISPDIE